MRFFNYLEEEYLTLGKALIARRDRAPFEIFVNPSSKELQGLPKDIRYIADFEHKKLYVWDADYIHLEGFIAIEKSTGVDLAATVDFISTGAAKKVGNKLHFGYADAADFLYNKPWSTMDDTWLNKWFDMPYTKTYVAYAKKVK